LHQGLYGVDAPAVDRMIGVCLFEARREPQRGPGKHSRGAPNIFTGLLWREMLCILVFKMVH